MSLTRTNPILTTVVGLLVEHLPVRFTVVTDTAEFVPDMVVVEAVVTPRPEWFTLGGPDKAHMSIQVTICGATRTDARLVGDEVRDVFTGTTRGKATRPLVREGCTFDLPTTAGDGHGDTTQGIHTWVETYQITWQSRVTPPSAP